MMVLAFNLKCKEYLALNENNSLKIINNYVAHFKLL
jgi:hypothetical protein